MGFTIYAAFYYTMIIPIFSLLLLYLPLGRSIKRGIRSLIGRLLFSRPLGINFQIIWLILFICSITLGANYFSLYSFQFKEVPPPSAPADTITLYQSKMWRAERNVYLSALTFVLWFSLYAVWNLVSKIARLEEREDIQIEGETQEHPSVKKRQ